jgi:hypothetical protein
MKSVNSRDDIMILRAFFNMMVYPRLTTIRASPNNSLDLARVIQRYRITFAKPIDNVIGSIGGK